MCDQFSAATYWRSHCQSFNTHKHPVSHFLIIWGKQTLCVLGLFSSLVPLALAEKWLVNLLRSFLPSPAPATSLLFFPRLSSSFIWLLSLSCLSFQSSLLFFFFFSGRRIPEVSDRSRRVRSRQRGVRSPQVVFFILSSLLAKRGKRRAPVFAWIWLFCVWEGAEPRSRPPSHPSPESHVSVRRPPQGLPLLQRPAQIRGYATRSDRGRDCSAGSGKIQSFVDWVSFPQKQTTGSFWTPEDDSSGVFTPPSEEKCQQRRPCT